MSRWKISVVGIFVVLLFGNVILLLFGAAGAFDDWDREPTIEQSNITNPYDICKEFCSKVFLRTSCFNNCLKNTLEQTGDSK